MICPKCNHVYDDWGSEKHYLCLSCFRKQRAEWQRGYRESCREDAITENGIVSRKCVTCRDMFDQPALEITGKARLHVLCPTCREKLKTNKVKRNEKIIKDTVSVCHKLWYCLSSDELSPGHYYDGDVLGHLRGLNGKFRDDGGMICIAQNGHFERVGENQ